MKTCSEQTVRHKGRSATLVLLRHGSSLANEEGRFGGWDDVPLSSLGIEQARAAGQRLQRMGLQFDMAFTSVLGRATSTLLHCLDTLEQCWVPSVSDWRLNERHYGALQGMKKADSEALYGKEQVRTWRRGFWQRPPLLVPGDARDSYGHRRYEHLSRADVPFGESLQDTQKRVLGCWEQLMLPALVGGQNVLLVAHGNSIRALLMELEKITEHEIASVDVPNAVPLVYHLGSNGTFIAPRSACC